LKILKSYLRYLAIALIALFVARSLIILYDGLFDDIGRADVAVIFGSKVDENGQASERLKARLNGGIRIYRLGLIKKIIVSGGKGKEGFEEADVMKAYLLNANIPAYDIISDQQGYTTYETAINSAAIMRAHNYRSALIVTQYFHISRSKLALKKAGVPLVYSVHVPFFELRDIFSIPREVFAFYYYSFRSY
jgi:vancomycin permeability regulator SanA